jgi:hypothetical protein
MMMISYIIIQALQHKWAKHIISGLEKRGFISKYDFRPKLHNVMELQIFAARPELLQLKQPPTFDGDVLREVGVLS